MNPVVEVKNVYKSFRNVEAVRGIDLKIWEGQYTAILGPNGAGKTTLVEMIEGIQEPDKGEIRILGKAWKGNEDELHRAIGLSLQETRFMDKLTVREILKLFASFYELKPGRITEIMDSVGLTSKRDAYAVNLSGGQRQRLALGIALLNRPRILLLDEPTTGLDPNARREIWAILLELKAHTDTALILTTHYMEEAEQLCDNIMIIDQGRVLKEGTLSQLLSESEDQQILEFTIESPPLSSPSIDQLRKSAPFQIQWNEKNGGGTLAVSDIVRDLPDFFRFLSENDARLKNLESRKKTLDDLFTSMTGRRLNE